jgi:hypothetical protein
MLINGYVRVGRRGAPVLANLLKLKFDPEFQLFSNVQILNDEKTATDWLMPLIKSSLAFLCQLTNYNISR